MARAIELGSSVRTSTSPNPWVGAVILDASGEVAGEGATSPPGGGHAEVAAIAAAGERAKGATLYVTLEPCAHEGRTGPCTKAILDSGVARVVVGIADPDRAVNGRGLEQLRRAGVEVNHGVLASEVTEQLGPYLTHRRTGRPMVVLKLAMTLDGRIAAPDGSSKWITGQDARRDAHRLRAESDAVLVGAGTVRSDDPALTVRYLLPDDAGDARDDDSLASSHLRQPLRVVLGAAPPAARLRPALEWEDSLESLLDELGGREVLQLLVEGGALVAHSFHAARLVDRYVFYVAPALLGGSDGRAVFEGSGAPSLADAWRGEIASVARLGQDLRIDVIAAPGQ